MKQKRFVIYCSFINVQWKKRVVIQKYQIQKITTENGEKKIAEREFYIVILAI